MFRSRKLINLKKMLFLKNQKMLQNLESSGWKISLLQVTQFTENLYVCLHFSCFKVSATFGNFCKIFSSTEWFQQQRESTNEIESMEVDELNKCLPKLYVSVRKTDGSYFKKTSLLSIRATLDRHLKAPKSFKNMSLSYFIFWNNHQVIILKQLVASGD